MPTDSPATGTTPSDPLGNNPFPKPDPRHKEWKTFSRSVKQDLSYRRKKPDWAARFDIHAERAHNRFSWAGDTGRYNQILQSLAEAVLRRASRRFRGRTATQRHNDLRDRIDQRQRYWKELAEALPEGIAKGTMADAAFWQKREDEFRKHDTHENESLQAEWYSEGEKWRLRGGTGEESERVFKSLAREAAKGFTGPRNADSWKTWLDAMRRDEWGFRVTSEGGGRWYTKKQWDSLKESGVTFPPEKIEVREVPKKAASPSGATTKQYGLREFVGEIPRVFKASADYCLDLRSRAELSTQCSGNGADKGTPEVVHTAPAAPRPSEPLDSDPKTPAAIDPGAWPALAPEATSRIHAARLRAEGLLRKGDFAGAAEWLIDAQAREYFESCQHDTFETHTLPMIHESTVRVLCNAWPAAYEYEERPALRGAARVAVEKAAADRLFEWREKHWKRKAKAITAVVQPAQQPQMFTSQEAVVESLYDRNVNDEDVRSKIGAHLSARKGRRPLPIEARQERIALEDKLRKELQSLKGEARSYQTIEALQGKFRDFVVWSILDDDEYEAILAGEFQIKGYAACLTLRKFRLTSRQTLKADRKALKRRQ